MRETTLENFGAVSQETALEMAHGVKKLAASDYAVSITGIAGPAGGTAEKPTGLVYIAIVGPHLQNVICKRFIGNRSDIRQRAANTALDLLRRELIKTDPHAKAKK